MVATVTTGPSPGARVVVRLGLATPVVREGVERVSAGSAAGAQNGLQRRRGVTRRWTKGGRRARGPMVPPSLAGRASVHETLGRADSRVCRTGSCAVRAGHRVVQADGRVGQAGGRARATSGRVGDGRAWSRCACHHPPGAAAPAVRGGRSRAREPRTPPHLAGPGERRESAGSAAGAENGLQTRQGVTRRGRRGASSARLIAPPSLAGPSEYP